MSKVNVIYEIGQEYLYDDINYEYEVKVLKDKGKNVKISSKIFDLMLSEGMIRKVDDGYVFVGKYEDLMELKKIKH